MANRLPMTIVARLIGVPDDDADAPTAAADAGGGEAQSAESTGSAGNDSDIQPTTGTHSEDANQQANPQQ